MKPDKEYVIGKCSLLVMKSNKKNCLLADPSADL